METLGELPSCLAVFMAPDARSPRLLFVPLVHGPPCKPEALNHLAALVVFLGRQSSLT